jgi:hypothetical protein
LPYFEESIEFINRVVDMLDDPRRTKIKGQLIDLLDCSLQTLDVSKAAEQLLEKVDLVASVSLLSS